MEFQTFNSAESMFESMKTEANSAFEEFKAHCSSDNVDFGQLCKPAIETDEIEIYDNTAWAKVFFRGQPPVDIVNDKYKKNHEALVQIFYEGGSMIIGFNDEQLDDAGFNWNRDEVLDKDDRKSRLVAAMLLNTGSQTVGIIAKHIAYTETAPDSGKSKYGVDTLGIHRVWD